jgi:hypothetical protein
MSDSFNPQEILSRLRAKPSGGAGSGGAPIVESKSTQQSVQISNKLMKTPPSLVLTATQVLPFLTFYLSLVCLSKLFTGFPLAATRKSSCTQRAGKGTEAIEGGSCAVEK